MSVARIIREGMRAALPFVLVRLRSMQGARSASLLHKP
jgi:hypothetical protein